LIFIYQGLEEEHLDQKSPGPLDWGLMQRASSSPIAKKTRNAKKPNTKPRKSDGDRRLKLRNRTLKFGAWNVQGCRNKMEEIIREKNLIKKLHKTFLIFAPVPLYIGGKFKI
jgi:hypothetical protein